MSRKKVKRGFTLLELSGVIAIIGILAAILLPALARARESGRRVSCMANLMNFSVALQCYAQENERALPWSGGGNNARCLLNLRGDYLDSDDLYVCPSDSNGDWNKEDREVINANMNSLRNASFSVRASYDYLGAYTTAPIVLPPNTRPLPPRVPIMWDLAVPGAEPDFSTRREINSQRWGNTQGLDINTANHIPGGSNVLMLDGSIEFIKWEEVYKPWMPLNPLDIAYDMPQPATEQETKRVNSISSNPIRPIAPLRGEVTPYGAPFKR